MDVANPMKIARFTYGLTGLESTRTVWSLTGQVKTAA